VKIEVAKKVKRRLNIKGLIFLLLVIYIIVMLFYTFLSMPIKNIYIKNTSLLTDNEVIEAAGIKDYPSIFKISSKKLEKKIESLELVNSVSVTKTIFGKLVIDIDEATPLFYNRNTNKVMLSNYKEVEYNTRYLGIPTLINYVPSDLLESFVSAFNKVDTDIIKMINEIEYDPDISDDITIDAERFLLRMNDTNIVYINILNIKRLNDYKDIFSTMGSIKGTVYLDSYNSDNIPITPFGSSDTGDSDNDGED
jgi:cell division septal protein FtsQ